MYMTIQENNLMILFVFSESNSGGENQRKSTDVRLVNLLYVSKMNIEKEAPAHNNPPPPPPYVNVEKVFISFKEFLNLLFKNEFPISSAVISIKSHWYTGQLKREMKFFHVNTKIR